MGPFEIQSSKCTMSWMSFGCTQEIPNNISFVTDTTNYISSKNIGSAWLEDYGRIQGSPSCKLFRFFFFIEKRSFIA